ncbi:hypothetical protein SCNU_16703 [Gordonia neofelifaecis NRRL B-59395]|uniref:Uncharacterized protein n=1 Tax=Gordonia neofelifaecis NRRL B-59395 TaxID=644548 RepID=F1YN33_9ACTN|nr:hypothetical protein SCNU_16703 [Gordonia neofelifaecis NRRL B-59395]
MSGTDVMTTVDVPAGEGVMAEKPAEALRLGDDG